MKCASCGSENASSSRFCSQCGSQLQKAARCEACGRTLPAGAQYCPGCGYQLSLAPMVQATDTFEQQLYQATRSAFYRRFVERLERKSAETSLYGVVRLLARRPIELDMAASLSDLAAFLTEAARPYVASLRTREVLVDLSGFLAGASGEVQQELDRLDTLSRAAAADLIDHPIGRYLSHANPAVPLARRIWPGIGACIGAAVDPSQISGRAAAECETLIQQLNEAFLAFVAAYDRLWLPLFAFVERYLATKCHLLWRNLATFEVDFRRYTAHIGEAKNQALGAELEAALEATRLARAAGPQEVLAPLLEGHILYRLGRRVEALTAFEQASTLQLTYVSLEAEKHFWSGRCLFDEGRYEEAIPTFEALVALPKQQVEARYFMEGEFLLAHAYLLTADVVSGARRLKDAILDGYTEVATLLTDRQLADARQHEAFRSTVRSTPFLQALSRHSGIHPLGSTYLSRLAAPVRQATAPGAWLELDTSEDLVFFFDASRNGSGRNGLCLTDRRLLWKAVSGRALGLSLGELSSVQLRDSELALNGKLMISAQIFDRLEALHRLLSLVMKAFAD